MLSKCKSRMFSDIVFSLNTETEYGVEVPYLRVQDRNSATNLYISKGALAEKLFTMFNLYTNTPIGNEWLEKHFTPHEIEQFWLNIDYIKSIVE